MTRKYKVKLRHQQEQKTSEHVVESLTFQEAVVSAYRIHGKFVWGANGDDAWKIVTVEELA